MEVVIRLLPDADADGATNMAADEAMVRSAAQGIASLRLYGWEQATASLGYFQSASVLRTDSRLSSLPFVRRPSGGATLVHHHELTYALALPHGSAWHSSESWMPRMHRIITAALTTPGLQAQIETVAASVKHGEVLCFQQYTPGDLLCQGKKIVGSAQRKHHQALLQHGSILLAQSAHTPVLPGILELTGAFVDVSELRASLLRAFVADTAWRIESGEWSRQEQANIEELKTERYSASSWNEKR